MATFEYNFYFAGTPEKQYKSDDGRPPAPFNPPVEVVAEPEVETQKSDWVLMPPEATRKMLEAFFGHHRFDDSWFYAYRQMVQEAQKQRGNLK